MIILLFVFLSILLTRVYNLSWGLPLPFHPDERNMALAVSKLSCSSLSNCLKPDFFAYGQFPLYFSYFFNLLLDFLRGVPFQITFVEATLGLRILSLLASFGTTYYLLKIGKIFFKKEDLYWFAFLSIFPPFFIQFAHFGTTESLLMLSFTALVFYSLRIFEKGKNLPLFKISFFLGLGIATKITAASFIFIPALAFILSKRFKLTEVFYSTALVLAQSVFISFVLSPYNFLAYKELFYSLSYEVPVASGKIKVFYTRQFEDSLPVVFQILNILPYSLGIIATILLLGALLFLKNERRVLFLKLSFVIFFLSQAFLYTKWTRFLAPIFPLGFLLSFLALQKIRNRLIFLVASILIILQGLAFFGVYLKEDPRFTASRWMIENIPSNATILSETANVVDLPVFRTSYFYNPYYRYYSFDFYNLDQDETLKKQLKSILSQTDYIIVPSRRVFLNHTCFYPAKNFFERVQHKISLLGFKPGVCEKRQAQYPLVNEYYKKLFDGSLGFKLVAEFENYPKFLFFKFPDELAEETFSVFDHPVVRVYKKSAKLKAQKAKLQLKTQSF